MLCGESYNYNPRTFAIVFFKWEIAIDKTFFYIIFVAIVAEFANFALKLIIIENLQQTMSTYPLDSLDKKILSMLSQNSRIPFLEVARECNVSGAAVHQRIQKLTNAGVVKGYETLIDPAALGYETCAYMGFFLTDPQDFDRVVAELHRIPEVVEVHYTTGKYDLLAKIYARNNSHLLSIIHDKLQSIGTARTETLISFKEEFRRPVPICEENE